MRRDHDHHRGRDAARHATPGVVEGHVGGEGVAQRHMGGHEARGDRPGADQVNGDPAARTTSASAMAPAIQTNTGASAGVVRSG